MANIKINDVPQRRQYVASAPTQFEFPIPFPFLADTDIVAWKDDVLLVRGGAPNQYILVGAGTASGGKLFLNTPAVAGSIITIIGSTPIDRTSIYSPTISNLTGDDLNSDLNRIIIMLQEVWTIQNYMMLQYKPFLELSQNINVTKDRWLPILPPLHGWMMNEENDEIVAAPFGGGGGGGDTFITVINQPAHGFTAGQVVFFNGTNYQLANAVNAGEAEVIGLVESVVNANNFNLLFGGMTDGLTGLVPGGVYFLSDTVDGELTLSEPTTAGHVSKPLVIAVNSTTGFFYNMRGKIINSPSFPWNPVASDTIMVADNNYFTTGGGLLNLYLPPIAAVGTIIRIAGYNSLGWHVVQDVGQSIDLGIDTTTVGVAGYIESITPKDTIELLCVVANTHWITLSSVGNITVI